jgi:hypothetical protein
MVNKICSPLVLGLVLALSGCGTGEMSLTEYVERINAIENQASRRGAELVADAAQVSDLTPQDVQAGLEQARAIRLAIKEATDDIEPPEQIAELHHLIFDWHTEFITVEEALANRAGAAADTATDWEALSSSPEMAAYRTAIADGKQVCNDFQAKLDATAERGVFADMPWVPSEMTEVVEAVLGCAWFPENPEDVYRYPPRTSDP